MLFVGAQTCWQVVFITFPFDTVIDRQVLDARLSRGGRWAAATGAERRPAIVCEAMMPKELRHLSCGSGDTFTKVVITRRAHNYYHTVH